MTVNVFSYRIGTKFKAKKRLFRALVTIVSRKLSTRTQAG